MQTTIKLKYNSFDKFKCALNSFVETNVDLTDCNFEPDKLKEEFFGSFDHCEFTVYHKNTEIIIVGKLVENELSITFTFPNRWNYVFDIIIFTLVGISIMVDINLYLGLAVTLFVLIQKFFLVRNEEKTKRVFLKKMEELFKNEAIVQKTE
jgi:hypothetical protein